MTPKEIITEALYNIYGSSTPETSVATQAATLMERIYNDAQRKAPWWFLERFFTYPAVNANIMSYKPDGIVQLPGTVEALASCNGLCCALVAEDATTLRLYYFDPKTLTVGKGGSFPRPIWQSTFELRYDEASEGLYVRLEDNTFSENRSRIYRITEKGDVITRITTTNLIGSSWDVRNGVIWYASPEYLVWDDYYQIRGRKVDGTETKLVGPIIGITDMRITENGIVITKRGQYGGLGAISTIDIWSGKETIITNGGTSCMDKMSRNGGDVYMAQPSSGSMKIRWFDTSVWSEYTHKGVIAVSPWDGDGVLYDIATGIPAIFDTFGNYMFIAEHRPSGDSILRLTDEKVGTILSMETSAGQRIKRVPVGSRDAVNATGIIPVYYTDEESAKGKRDVNIYPQAQYDTVSMRAIVFTDYDSDSSDIVTTNLEEYLLKKLTAELSLVTEYADRYAAYSQAADVALAAAKARNCDFDGQEVTPGYCGC